MDLPGVDRSRMLDRISTNLRSIIDEPLALYVARYICIILDAGARVSADWRALRKIRGSGAVQEYVPNLIVQVPESLVCSNINQDIIIIRFECTGQKEALLVKLKRT
jgi:hypothetical protein